MTDASMPNPAACPKCGADVASWDATCWLCGTALHLKQSDDASPESEQPFEAILVTSNNKPQFGLSTLLLIVTFVCICLGLVTIAPGLIIPLVVIVVPALIRTMSSIRQAGSKRSAAEKVADFLTSLGIVILTWVAGLIAFFTACTLIVLGGEVMNFNQDALSALMLLGIVLGLATLGLMIWLLRITWPGRRKKTGRNKQN